MTAAPSTPRGATLASDIARLWLRVYTLGISAAARDRRAAELESDLWEQERDADIGSLAPAMLGLQVFSRVVRGIPADLLWRFQLEGPQMQLRIPFERALGIVFLAMTVALPISLSISGYNTDANGWDGELTRLGEIPAWQRQGNTYFQAFSGIALVLAGAGLVVAPPARVRLVAGIAGFGLACAGVLTLVSSALYSSMSGLATEHVDGRSSESLLVTARTLGLTLDALTGLTSVIAIASVACLAYLAWRERLLPAWLQLLPAASVGFAAIGLVVSQVTGNDTVLWVLLSSSFLVLVSWLVVAGAMLALGREAHHPGWSAGAVQP